MGCIWLDREAEQGGHMSRAAGAKDPGHWLCFSTIYSWVPFAQWKPRYKNTISVRGGLLHGTHHSPCQNLMPSYQTSFKIQRVVSEEFTNYSPWVSVTTACSENKALLDNTCPFIHGFCHISAIQKLNSSTKTKVFTLCPFTKKHDLCVK